MSAAAHPGAGLLGPPPAPRRAAFALTPLADIMFQLLIFFMLSTSLAPYALLPVVERVAPAAGAEALPPSPAPPALAPAEPAVWHLGRGSLRAGDSEIGLEALPAALEALAEAGVAEVLLFVTEAAETQDLVAVLQEVRLAGGLRLRLIGR